LYREISNLASLKISIPDSIIESQIKRQSTFQRLFAESFLKFDENPKIMTIRAMGFQKKKFLRTNCDFSIAHFSEEHLLMKGSGWIKIVRKTNQRDKGRMQRNTLLKWRRIISSRQP
jgi:hypothetical protein